MVGNNGFLQAPLQCSSSLLFRWDFFCASMFCCWSWCQPNGKAVRKCFWSISTANTRNTLWNIFWGMFVDLQFWTSFSVLIGFLLALVSNFFFLNSWLCFLCYVVTMVYFKFALLQMCSCMCVCAHKNGLAYLDSEEFNESLLWSSGFCRWKLDQSD